MVTVIFIDGIDHVVTTRAAAIKTSLETVCLAAIYGATCPPDISIHIFEL